ncbi:catecholate siderophore receptor Fiu [Variovorax sp. YR216]|uniref:catecholate siderophore receptor Fiu n=1 Tax=Variovorax sp. YR216 TaxID=1882828 RepID=UPI000895DCAA|nr:catecholate siderophore receptor Fiu [Variovorax sp. YR216]SEB19220.1 catecholate siderophore receptor [Variovorax sp. YR216]
MAYIKSRKHARVLPPLGSAAAATLVALTLPVSAQTSTNTLKEVRVEGAASEVKVDNSANPKFTAPLVNTPQTIQIIPETVMREQGATTLTEALRNSPGVGTFFLGENGNTNTGDSIYMRGFDSSSSIFVDGIRDTGSVSRDTFNIEQVEVVKGPAGTDTGRTSPTGYINLITKKPQLSDSFLGSVSIGSDDFKRATIDWNKVLSGPDGIGSAFRLNAFTLDADAAGRDVVNNKRWGIAPSLAFGLNSPTRVYFDVLYVKQNNIPDGGVPTIGLPGYSSPDTSRRFLTTASPVDSSNFYGTQWDFDNVTQTMFTARVEHDFTPDVTLRNTFRYGKTEQDYMLTSFMGSSANLVTRVPSQPQTWTIARSNPTNKDQENTILTNQTNVSAKFNTGSIGHTMNAGVELIHEEQDSVGYYGQNATVFGVPGIRNSGSWPAANLYSPNPYVNGYLRLPNGTTTAGTTDTVGLYAFDTAKLSERWMLTGGLRFDHYSTDYSATALNATSGVLTPSAYSVSGSEWTGKLGVVYKPTDNSSVYLAYGTGAQPPGGNNFTLAAGGTGNSANRTDFLPQKTKSWELGTKWDLLDKKLAVSAALFRTDVSNEVVQDAVSGNYYQTGEKRVEGIELAAVGAITDRWSVTTGFTHQNAKVLSGPSVLADGGSVLAYTPENAFSAWTTYQLPFGLGLGIGARYNGKMYRGTDSAIGTPAYVEDYWVFDAMASYRINKNLDLQFNVFNLTDKEYVAAINKSGYRYTPGAPRTYRLTANFQF